MLLQDSCCPTVIGQTRMNSCRAGFQPCSCRLLLLAERQAPWSEQEACKVPARFKDAVQTLLLCAYRLGPGSVSVPWAVGKAGVLCPHIFLLVSVRHSTEYNCVIFFRCCAGNAPGAGRHW